MRWKVELSDQIKSGLISKADLVVLKLWVSRIEGEGLASVQTHDWHDHALDGDWRGHRSAAFSSAGRLIYRTEGAK